MQFSSRHAWRRDVPLRRKNKPAHSMPSPPYNPNRRRRPNAMRSINLALISGALSITGCGSGGATLSIEQLEQGFINEQQVEVDLGDYAVPIPVLVTESEGKSHYENILLLRFRLWALVNPSEESVTKRLIRRNRGKVRDRVMTECRNAPLVDVQDPNLTALRSRVRDRLQPLFDGDLLQRVFVTDVLIDPF